MFSLFLAQVIDAKFGQIVCLIINKTDVHNGLLEISVIMPILLKIILLLRTMLQKEKETVVNIPVYCRIQKSFDPTEEYFRDFRGFKMDQGLGLLLLNGLEWFEIGNNQPMTSASSHFRVTLEQIPLSLGGLRNHHRSRKPQEIFSKEIPSGKIS